MIYSSPLFMHSYMMQKPMPNWHHDISVGSVCIIMSIWRLVTKLHADEITEGINAVYIDRLAVLNIWGCWIDRQIWFRTLFRYTRQYPKINLRMFKWLRPDLHGVVVTMHEGANRNPEASGLDVLFAQAPVHCHNNPLQISFVNDYDMTLLFSSR